MLTKTTSFDLFVDDGGSGDLPVVFIHSLAGNTRQWTAQLTYARQTRRAIALDLRGHGRSQGVDGGLAIDSLAQDVHAAVEKLGLEKFMLVGHSMGGSVAVAYAGTQPERVAGLLLVDPSGDSTQVPTEEVQGFMEALASPAYTNVIEGYWQQILDGAVEATQTAVMQDLRHTPQTTVVGILNELFQFKPTPALNRYDGPKLSVITPLNDVPFALHNLVPNLPHIMVNGTGHWLHMDKPDVFNQILDEFIMSVDHNSG